MKFDTEEIIRKKIKKKYGPFGLEYNSIDGYAMILGKDGVKKVKVDIDISDVVLDEEDNEKT